ncbi:MAG: Uncharacterized aldehyde oxidase, 2Fe-2S subunit [uncultured Caballeronia sp.]|nr:MAG: Uncharacterized aldehyde oxidase, 2Fe-2S subunit [uncultured Caballeronia sp.]
MIQLTVNGVQHALDDPSTPLLYALRNNLQLHGAKFGCGLGQCGACTVIVGDRATFSCLLPVSAIGDCPVRTIESLGTVDHPGPLQKAFIEHQAAQCGYCIAGMVMCAQALLDRTPHPTEAQLRENTWNRIFAVAALICAFLRQSGKWRVFPKRAAPVPPMARQREREFRNERTGQSSRRGAPPLHAVRCAGSRF